MYLFRLETLMLSASLALLIACDDETVNTNMGGGTAELDLSMETDAETDSVCPKAFRCNDSNERERCISGDFMSDPCAEGLVVQEMENAFLKRLVYPVLQDVLMKL